MDECREALDRYRELVEIVLANPEKEEEFAPEIQELYETLRRCGLI